MVGVARADVPLDVDHARYEAFVARGSHGDMGFLAELPEARKTLDHEEILKGARA